jgi:hypothetical protein
MSVSHGWLARGDDINKINTNNYNIKSKKNDNIGAYNKDLTCSGRLPQEQKL